MRILLMMAALFAGMWIAPASAARVEARVDISQQKMRVYQEGK